MMRLTMITSGVPSCIIQLAMLLLAAAAASEMQTPGTKLPITTRRIDTHCHFVPDSYSQKLHLDHLDSGGLPIPTWNASLHLALNAQLGIETSILSASTPGAKLSKDAPVEEGRALARELNEFAHNLTLQYPKRFLFFATLTLPDVEGAVTEAIYALDNLHAAGVILLASAFGELLGTPRYAPLYAVLNERNATVFIHPSNSPCPEEPIETANSTDVPPFVIDFLLDTSRAAINLVYRNVTRDYPNINFILAHSGGFLPFAGTRAAGGLAIMSGSGAREPEFYQELKKFHVDLAISATESALPSTTVFFDNTHITFGTDFPYAPIRGIATNSDFIQIFHSKDELARNRINFLNSYTLFNKFLV